MEQPKLKLKFLVKFGFLLFGFPSDGEIVCIKKFHEFPNLDY